MSMKDRKYPWGVLIQRLGSEPQPVAYLSKRLYPTSWGCPPSPTPPLKSCRYCTHDRKCFKTLLYGQSIFTSHQVKQLLNEKGRLWMSDQSILRYQVMLMEILGCIISPYEVLNPVTLLPTAKGSLPFHSCLEILTSGRNPERDCQKILWPILRTSGTLMEEALSQMEKKELDMQ